MKSFAIRLAYDAGKLLIARFGDSSLQVTRKGINPRTRADIISNKSILSSIRARFPDHDVLSEETRKRLRRKSDYMWIVDPCDGTVNFISGVPFFAVSIALMFKSEIIIGVVYDPVRDEMFVARKDEGAFLNGQRIQVGTRRTLRYSTLGIDFAHRTSQIRQEIRIVERLAGEVQVVRSFYSGALELCYVSTGRIDIRIDDSYKLWDVAAGSLIAREAGARVTDLDGMHWGPRCLSIVAANQALHRQIMHKLRSQR